MFKQDCPFCHPNGCASNLLIHEFTHSYWVLGNHQYYPGYSLLYLKQHARELHELDAKIQDELFKELMLAGKTIATVYSPWKMNYASYGNQVEHIHWHIFPRYLSDPHHLQPPFTQASEFAKFPTDLKLAQQKIELLRKHVA